MEKSIYALSSIAHNALRIKRVCHMAERSDDLLQMRAFNVAHSFYKLLWVCCTTDQVIMNKIGSKAVTHYTESVKE